MKIVWVRVPYPAPRPDTAQLSKPGDSIMFDERKLYEEIVRIWGAYGAHAEVFKMMYAKMYPDNPCPDWMK